MVKRKAGSASMYTNEKRKVFRKYKTASKATTAAVKKVVRGLIETKGVDFPLTIAGPVVATVSTNDNCFCLNLTQQGNGSWNRVGRKINLQSLRLRGEALFISAAAATTGNILANQLRMVVVWDKQPSGGALPTFDTVFGVTGQDATETTTYLNPVKYDNMERFSVLRDKVMTFIPEIWNNEGGTADLTQLVCHFDEFIKLNNRETVYLASSNPATIADVSTGAIYVYFRAKEATDQVNDISITANSFARLRYQDP